MKDFLKISLMPFDFDGENDHLENPDDDFIQQRKLNSDYLQTHRKISTITESNPTIDAIRKDRKYSMQI